MKYMIQFIREKERKKKKEMLGYRAGMNRAGMNRAGMNRAVATFSFNFHLRHEQKA